MVFRPRFSMFLRLINFSAGLWLVGFWLCSSTSSATISITAEERKQERDKRVRTRDGLLELHIQETGFQVTILVKEGVTKIRSNLGKSPNLFYSQWFRLQIGPKLKKKTFLAQFQAWELLWDLPRTMVTCFWPLLTLPTPTTPHKDKIFKKLGR